MQLQIDGNKSYGIVLEGGGARGAYQVGAWKALREAGIQIRGIAGASVGALNGALMCMDDFGRAEEIWKTISYSRIMDVEDGRLEALRSFRLKNRKAGWDFKEVAESALRLFREGGFDVTPLRRLIEEVADETAIRSSDRELYVTTVSLDERRPLVINVKELPEGAIPDALLASAYFPAFKNEKLGGRRYMDGGSLNNVPVDVLLNQGYQDIIVMRIYGLGFDTEKVVKIPEGVQVSHIAPRQDLGGILEFEARRATKNMKLGYLDAMRMLYGLGGQSYYFDAPRTEAYYFDKMMSELELVCREISPALEPQECMLAQGYRSFTERIFPALAAELGLREDWNYKTLYLAILEKWARKLRMPRMKIYTPDQVVGKIHARSAGKLDMDFRV